MSYSPVYRIIHWAMALIIIPLIGVGLYMADLPDTATNKAFLYEMHKSFGFIILILGFMRLFVRLKHGLPAPLATLTRFERVASSSVHHVLWVLMLLMPITGYLGVSMCCAPLKLFFTLPVTFPISGSDEAAKLLFRVHEWAGKLLALLLLAHAGAALFHHFIKKDGVLLRMLR